MADEEVLEDDLPVDEASPPPEPVQPRENEADQQRGGKKAVAPVPPAHSEPPEAPTAGLEAMEQQLREANARADRIEQASRRLQTERDQALALAQEAEKRGISTQELMIEDQIKATAGQLDSLTEQQATAWSDGDFAKAAQINRKMQELTVSHGFLNEKKLWLAQQRERQQQPPPAPPQAAADSAPPADPFEARIHGKYSPNAAAFLRKHQDLVRSDGSLKRVAIEAHEAALDEGFTADTPGYYDRIERILGQPKEAEVNGAAPPAAPKAGAPTTAAPVSRGNVRVPGGGGKPQITPNQRRLAIEQGQDPDEWFAHYNRLLAEGKISPVR